MSEVGLTPTDQAPAATVATIALEDGTVTDLWCALFESHPFREAFIRGVRALAEGETAAAFDEDLADRGVPGWLRWQLLDVARGDRRAAWALVATAGEGPDRSARRLGTDVGSVEELLATAGLVDGLEETDAAPPTIAVTLGAAFRERRRDQREAVLALLDRLARGFDVRLVVSGLTRRFLLAEHRTDLAGVSEWCNGPRGPSPVEALVEAALVDLDPDGREVRLLRALAAAPGETLAYAECYAEEAEVDNSRVRQVLGRLVDLGLVATFATSTGKHAELLAAGREFLATLDAEVGRQTSLEDASERVSESGQTHTQAVLSREHGEGERPAGETAAGDGAPADRSAPYSTAYLGRPAHAAAAGTADSGAVTLANSRLEAASEGPDHVRYVSYDDGRDEAVVAVRATGALQYVVSLATALASPRFLDRALPVDRLEAIDDPPAILRDARCVGWLPEEAVEDPSVLRETLVEEGEHLETLTTDLRRGEYDDRDRFRGEILRTAHGLAGTIAHLCDAVGVDLVREIRVPGGLDADHLAELARSVAVSAAIQSRYGAFASYRQLYEGREDKRRAAFTPDVDAADPVGTVIGSYVVRGPDVHRLRSHLERHLSDPADLHDDAPEFAVRVPVREAGREAVAGTTSRVLGRKRLRPTRAAVSLLAAFTASPYAAAEALHQLGDVHAPRDVRPDELRYALATLDADALLPGVAPTARAIVATLLRAEGRLSQTALADRAGVSTRSVRRHRDVLEALDLVDVTADADGGGWRLTLSFPTTEDRRAGGVLPAPIATDTSLSEVVDAVAAALLPPEEYADPGGDVYESLCWPADPWALAEDPRLEGWLQVAAALVEADPPTEDTTVRMGPTLEQTPLPAGGVPEGPPSPAERRGPSRRNHESTEEVTLQ